MKQLNLQKLQNDLRKKFFKLGVKMNGPETIFFSKDTKVGKNVIIVKENDINFIKTKNIKNLINKKKL